MIDIVLWSMTMSCMIEHRAVHFVLWNPMGSSFITAFITISIFERAFSSAKLAERRETPPPLVREARDIPRMANLCLWFVRVRMVCKQHKSAMLSTPKTEGCTICSVNTENTENSAGFAPPRGRGRRRDTRNNWRCLHMAFLLNWTHVFFYRFT